uniref:Si:ch211-216p19.6 n=1 Tax=Sinocyclocheilus grahami TaxID=75366 RepID=A0A672RXY3_SINGR
MASSISSQVGQCLCSICQDFFSDPVTIPCGHNFCMECITQHWDSSMGTQCPLCKKNFHLRPDLGINREFRELIEGLKRGESPVQPGAVPCDHERPLELFCRDDQKYVCLSCTTKDHRTHNTVPVEEESEERKLHFGEYPLDVNSVCCSVSAASHGYAVFVQIKSQQRRKPIRCLRPADILQNVNVTMDPETAHPKISLSEDDKQAGYGETRQIVPDSPWRFDTCPSILGKEGFSSGKFYFEVQVKGKTEWDIGVARENGSEYKACDCLSVSLCLKVKPQKLGVYVDYEEGLVSFYDVESRSHIYSFTEKLYPYFILLCTGRVLVWLKSETKTFSRLLVLEAGSFIRIDSRWYVLKD